MNSEKLENTFQIVGPKNIFPKVTLVDPTNSSYLLFALEIDRRPPIGFFIESQLKKKILSKLKNDVVNLRNNSKVIDATVFKAMIIPPGRGAFLKKRPSIEIAKFDRFAAKISQKFDETTERNQCKLPTSTPTIVSRN